MRNIFVALLLALFCLNLSGCGPLRTPAEMAELDYGPYPEDYQELVIQYMSRRLADPYSARYEFQGLPEQHYERTGLLSFNSSEYWGWSGIVYINAKNGFGAYTGADFYRYIIKNGEVIWMF